MTRVYDIRSLLAVAQNHMGPSLDLNNALSNTNSGGIVGRFAESRGNPAGTATSIFGDEDFVEDSPSRDELIDSIITLIQDTVGTPEAWVDLESSIRELNGNLIVRTTPAEHDAINALLHDLEANAGKLITTKAVFVELPRDVLDDFLAEGGRSLVLDAEGHAALMSLVREHNGRVLGSTRNVGFNEQRVFVYAGLDRTFLSDTEPVPDAQGLDPTLSLTREGVVLDVLPTISLDGSKVTMAISADVTLSGPSRTKPLAIGGVAPRQRLDLHLDGPVRGTVTDPKGEGEKKQERPLDADATLNGEMRLPAHGPTPPPVVAELDLPAGGIVSYRTTARVPDGGALILGGVAQSLPGIEARANEVLLILAPAIIRD